MKGALNDISFGNSEGFRSVEDGLFPMSVLSLRTGAEVDGFVAA